jgi:hypothetical protein
MFFSAPAINRRLPSQTKERFWYNEIQENPNQLLDQKEFLFNEIIYDNGFSTSEMWMNKDKLKIDASWLWFVVWLLCCMCWIMKLMLEASWLLFIVWDSCLMCKNWWLGSFPMYQVYLFILHLLIFLELLTSLIAFFVIPFSVWQVHHHFCNNHPHKIRYDSTILS